MDSQARARILYVAVLLGAPGGDEFLRDALQSQDRHVRTTAEDLAEYLANNPAVGLA